MFGGFVMISPLSVIILVIFLVSFIPLAFYLAFIKLNLFKELTFDLVDFSLCTSALCYFLPFTF